MIVTLTVDLFWTIALNITEAISADSCRHSAIHNRPSVGWYWLKESFCVNLLESGTGSAGDDLIGHAGFFAA